MRRITRNALAALAAAAMTLGLAAPASAGVTEVRSCNEINVAGATNATAQITYLTGVGVGSCGTLGLRVQYSHVGGYSWTAWKYSAFQGDYVRHSNTTPVKSQHTTTHPVNNFYSLR